MNEEQFAQFIAGIDDLTSKLKPGERLGIDILDMRRRHLYSSRDLVYGDDDDYDY